MAVISVRELLRDATTVFEGMERDREPVLITRRGRPVAALVPVNPEQAEAMILSSAPALIESRRRAEQAIAEGRTTPLEDALRELDAEESATTGIDVTGEPAAEQDYVVHFAGHGNLPELLPYLLGVDRAEEVNRVANRYVHQITYRVVINACQAGLIRKEEQQELANRIVALNARLFILRLRGQLVRDLLGKLAALTDGTTPLDRIANPTEGLVGKALTDAALDEASTFVHKVNTDIVMQSKRGARLSHEIFEATLAGSVDALERSDLVTR